MRVVSVAGLAVLSLTATVACVAAEDTHHSGSAAAVCPADSYELWRSGALRGANMRGWGGGFDLEDARVLRSWGANLAVISFSRLCERDPPYRFLPERLAEIDRLVDSAEQAGLFVVLTCRGGPGRSDFETDHRIFTDQDAQAAYAHMWQRVAEHYKGRPAIVGYDLMCEPHPDDPHFDAGLTRAEAAEKIEGTPADWNILAKKITASVRQVDSDTPILVSSINWGYPQMFDFLKPTGDPRTVYVVHFYSPHQYTHQKPDEPVDYPGVVPGHVEPRQHWDRQTIRGTLSHVRRFQEKHNVPIFVGEFSTARWSPNALEYLRDVLDPFEEWGWCWAYWSFREWHIWDLEMTACAEERDRHAETPRLGLLKQHFSRNTAFLQPPVGVDHP